MIILELMNMGGLIGKHKFEFREGVNEVIAPNASGKSSLIRSLLAMYAPMSIPADRLLNMDAEEGYIKVIINGNKYVRKFKRKNGEIIEVETKPIANDLRIKYVTLDLYLGEVVRKIVIEENPDLTDYLVKVFRLDDYEQKKEELRREIEELEKEESYLIHDVEELKIKNEVKKSLEKRREELREKLKELRVIVIEKVRGIQDRIALLSRRLGEIEARIRDIKENLIPTTKDRLKEVELEIERLEKIIEDFYKLHREPEEEIEEIKKRIKGVEEYVEILKRELNDYIKGQDARLPVVRLAIRTKARTCPICGRPVERPEIFWSKREKDIEEDIRKSKETVIKDYENRINKGNNELKLLWKELQDLQTKYNEIREIESIKLPKLRSSIDKMRKQIEEYEKESIYLKNTRDTIYKQLEALKKQLSVEEQEEVKRREKIEKELGEIEQKIKDLEEEIAKKSEAGERLAKVRRILEEKKKALSKVEKEFYGMLTRMSDEFSRLSSEIIKELGFTWLKSIRLHKIDVPKGKKFTIKVIRAFPSGREAIQPLATMSTSERMVVALIAVLVGYRLKILDDYKGLAPILADEALLMFDPARFDKVISELNKYGKYVIITRLVEPEKAPKLTVIYQ